MNSTVFVISTLLFALEIALCFQQHARVATSTTFFVAGIGYFIWNALSISGLADVLVDSDTRTRMITGAVTCVIGIILYYTDLFAHTRKTMPRK